MYKIEDDALGNSESFLDFQEEVQRLSKIDRPILILGERGTGKELAARSLHFLSKRWDKPYITFLCSALSPNLLEDALFGHEQGSFTGASSRSIGYFERAHQGSIFLDEVADIPLSTQDKLLRVLEYGSFERIGGQKTIQVDLKIIAATNKDIFKLRDEGFFRADLLDRLCFDLIRVPPLRERGDDLIILARYFAINMASELGLSGEITFSDYAMEQLYAHLWQGNVRELKNVIERTVCRLNSLEINELFINLVPITDKMTAVQELSEQASDQTFQKSNDLFIPQNFSLNATISHLEKKYINQALIQAKYKQKSAATLLGLSYDQFRTLYKRYKPQK